MEMKEEAPGVTLSGPSSPRLRDQAPQEHHRQIPVPAWTSHLPSLRRHVAISAWLQVTIRADKNLLAWVLQCDASSTLLLLSPTWQLPEPLCPSHFTATQRPQKHLTFLLLSLFEALNKKSKQISRKEAEKKRSSKVRAGKFWEFSLLGWDWTYRRRTPKLWLGTKWEIFQAYINKRNWKPLKTSWLQLWARHPQKPRELKSTEQNRLWKAASSSS